MPKKLWFSFSLATLALFLSATGSLQAADAGPKDAKDDVINAAKALGNVPNYSWRTTMENANGGFRRGPTDGKTEKDGCTTLHMSFNDNAIDAIIKGANGALKAADGGWQSAAEATQGDGTTAFIARTLPNVQTPATEAVTLVGYAQSLSASTNGISGEFTEEGARNVLLFRRGNGAGGGFTASNAKGTVTFWLADGKLVKYQTHITGTMSVNGTDHDIDRTTTTEIKDIGTTKIEVPDDAKKKLE